MSDANDPRHEPDVLRAIPHVSSKTGEVILDSFGKQAATIIYSPSVINEHFDWRILNGQIHGKIYFYMHRLQRINSVGAKLYFEHHPFDKHETTLVGVTGEAVRSLIWIADSYNKCDILSFNLEYRCPNDHGVFRLFEPHKVTPQQFKSLYANKVCAECGGEFQLDAENEEELALEQFSSFRSRRKPFHAL
ncbi:MAG: hypothetical protein EOP06_26970 [Proteobacteria bacterium]|nr:MAG: hypothetical protein EOP06_26970 [Pseudomonadota bacterium]